MDLSTEPRASGFRRLWEWLNLPEAARRMRRADHRAFLSEDRGVEAAISLLEAWLAGAQRNAAPAEGGVSSHYSLLDGWSGPSVSATAAALRMLPMPTELLDAPGAAAWLAGRQKADGGFGGEDSRDDALITAQALLGLVNAFRVKDGDGVAVERAARRLVSMQADDGSWSGSGAGGPARDGMSAWALLESSRMLCSDQQGEAALKGMDAARGTQHRNGWLEDCGERRDGPALSLAVGFAVRAFLEVYRLDGGLRHLDAAVMAGWALVAIQKADGTLPGLLGPRWEAEAPWTCPAGNALVSCCWMLLHRHTGEEAFLRAARAANLFLRHTLVTSNPPDLVGGVRGSYPVDGRYEPYRLTSVGAALALEAQRMELSLSRTDPRTSSAT
jgi:hypothetical protein